MDQLVVTDQQVSRQGDLITLDMEIDVTHIDMGRNETLIVTPLLQSNSDPNVNAIFSPVIINGVVRNKVVNREIALNTENNLGKLNPFTIVERENRSTQVIQYHAKLPYEPWMNDASLGLASENRGCAGCDLGNEDKTLLARVLQETVPPDYQLTYIEPAPEPVKVRSERHSASFNYLFDRYDLLHNFKNNAAEFSKVDKVIKEIRSNSDLTVTELSVKGYASPEGPFEYNRTLSEKRANSFAAYLASTYQIERSQLKMITGEGEDWEGLRKAVESSSIGNKQEIIRIIDNVSPPDARDAELMKLSGGETYQQLLTSFYPPLRRTDYIIAYSVRAFSVEEAKAMLKSDPRLLSLNEMYLVAETYPKESKEFREVFDIAARLFPNDPIAIINSAAADLEGGNFTAALERLEKVKEDPRAWNNLGVAYAKAGDLTTAADYFTKAAANGDPMAAANREEMKKVMEIK
jgi:outer membrane protein OmpA-like peptidoglycan-associated protein